MAPNVSKANYKTYEAQARMVRAIVAAHPDVKWNYKEIAACYGSDMTEHALNHRFRRLRAQALIVREARRQRLDMKHLMSVDDLPTTQDGVDCNNIAKYFGQSTADGIQFQFRGIKKDAEKLRQVESAGGDVATCLGSSIGTSSAAGGSSTPLLTTPSKPTPSRCSTGSRQRSGGTAGRKRALPVMLNLKRSSSDEDDDDPLAAVDDNNIDDDYYYGRGGGGASADDDDNFGQQTPSKRGRTTPAVAGQKTATPRRAAAKKASATIATAAAQLQDSQSPAPMEERFAAAADPGFVSIFGPGKPPTVDNMSPAGGGGGGYATTSSVFQSSMDDGYGDGEI